MDKRNALYKFVTCDTNEIIYIGSSNNQNNLKSQIIERTRGRGKDEKFNAYKDNYKIFVAYLPNAFETNIIKRALINQYKPILNYTDDFKGLSNLIQIKEPQWIEFEKEFSSKKTEMVKSEKQIRGFFSEFICIGNLFGKEYYLSNNRPIREHEEIFNTQIFDSVDEALEFIKYTIYLCDKYGKCDVKSHSYIVPAQYSNNRYISFWNQKRDGISPWLIISSDTSLVNYPIINSLYGKDVVLKEIRFNRQAIDICKLVIEEFTNQREYWVKSFGR